MSEPKENELQDTAQTTDKNELSQQDLEGVAGGNALNPQPLPPVHDPHPGGGGDDFI